MKALVVDDSQIMRKIVTGALKKVGIDEIVEAANGQEAVDVLLKDKSIDLVLMDWNMPVMSGIDALKKIRADSNPVPIVMVTTEAEQDKVLEALKSGASDYLAKPFGPKEIKAKLEKFMTPSN